MKYCPNCQNACEDIARHCPYCGNPLPTSDTYPTNPSQTYPYSQPTSNGYPAGSNGEPYPKPYPSNVSSTPRQNANPAGSYASYSSRQNQNGKTKGKKGSSPYGRPPKKSSKAVWITLLVTAAVAGTAAGGYYFLHKDSQSAPVSDAANGSSPNSQALSIQTAPDSGEETEEAKYLKILESSPADPDAVTGLYSLYVENGSLEQASAIEQNALDSAMPSEKEAITAATMKVDRDHQLVTTPEGKKQYEVVAEMGVLDRVPISLGDEIWAIRKDGLYSFVGPDGKTVSKTQNESLRILIPFRGNGEPTVYGCLGDSLATSNDPADEYPYNPDALNPFGTHCLMNPAGISPLVYTVMDGKAVIEEAGNGGAVHTDKEVNPELEPVILTESADRTSPYIYNPYNQKLSGPYEKGNPGCFFHLTSSAYEEKMMMGVPNVGHVYNQGVGSPFWSQDGVLYSLYSKDGRNERTGFEQAKIVDMDSIMAWQNGCLQVYDKNLELEYAGPFEEGAHAISGVMPVCIDGSWSLIQAK